MNGDIKAKWLAALRSGEYGQCFYSLRKDGHKFCCLGVLCDVISPGEWAAGPDEEGDIPHGESCLMPPMEVVERAGLNVFYTADLSRMNDDRKTFATIADYIEDNL